MKVVERISKHRIRQQINIDDMQFRLVKGKGKRRHFYCKEKFIAKGKKLYFGFVVLEKAFDRVPTTVIKWAMHKWGVEE